MKKTDAQRLVEKAAADHAKTWARGGRRKTEKWPADTRLRTTLEAHFARDLAYQFVLRSADRIRRELGPTDAFASGLAAHGYEQAASIVLDRLNRFNSGYEGNGEFVDGRPRLEWALWYAFQRRRSAIVEAFAGMTGGSIAPDVAPALREVRTPYK